MAKATGSQVVPVDGLPAFVPDDPPQAAIAAKAHVARTLRKRLDFIFQTPSDCG